MSEQDNPEKELEGLHPCTSAWLKLRSRLKTLEIEHIFRDGNYRRGA